MITQHSQRVERLLLEHNAAMQELLSLGKLQATAGRKTEPPVVEVDAVNEMKEDTESTKEDKVKTANLARAWSGGMTETDLTSHDDAMSLPVDLYLSPVEDRKAFLQLVQQGDVRGVQSMLESSADPNWGYEEEVVVNGLKLTSASPLSVALLHEDKRMVQLLLEAGAAPTSTYSKRCGSEGLRHTFSSCVPCVVTGDLEMLQWLIRFRADPHVACPENNATLLWEAAYANKAHIAKYLAKLGVGLDRRAQFQDNSSLSHTPLHIASRMGNADVLEVLLEARANVDVHDGRGRGPLRDAVRFRYNRVAQLLISHGAPILSMRESDGPMRQNSTLFRHIEHWWVPGSRSNARAGRLAYLWQPQNRAMVGAVAQGLSDTPWQLSLLSSDDIINFIEADCTSPNTIMTALFQRIGTSDMRHWDQSLRIREERTMMYVKVNSQKLSYRLESNVVEGPDLADLQRLYKMKDSPFNPPNEHIEHFLNALLPQTCAPGSRKAFTNVATFKCRMSGIHNNFGLMTCIALHRYNQLFKTMACQALVDHWWHHRWVMVGSFLRNSLQIANIILYSLIIILLRFANVEASSSVFFAISWVIFVSWAWDVLWHLVYLLGMLQVEHTVVHFWEHMIWIDTATTVLTAVHILPVIHASLTDSSSYEMDDFKTLMLACVVILRWTSLFKIVVTVPRFGTVLLPVIKAAVDAGEFIMVLILFFSAMLSALLIMLPIRVSTMGQFLMVFRLAMFGDFEEVALHADLSNRISPSQSMQISLLVVTSFLVAVVLLNVFIAVLCKNYELQYEYTWPSFMKERAREAVNVYATKLGVHAILKTFSRGPLRKLWRWWSLPPASNNPYLWFSVSIEDRDLPPPEEKQAPRFIVTSGMSGCIRLPDL